MLWTDAQQNRLGEEAFTACPSHHRRNRRRQGSHLRPLRGRGPCAAVPETP